MNLQNQPLTETSLTNDPFYGHLNPEEVALYESTPIFPSTGIIRGFLSNLPIYRSGLSSISRGLEIGMAHGYFLLGPFTKLGPLRNSDLGLEMGLYSTFGLIIILNVANVQWLRECAAVYLYLLTYKTRRSNTRQNKYRIKPITP